MVPVYRHRNSVFILYWCLRRHWIWRFDLTFFCGCSTVSMIHVCPFRLWRNVCGVSKTFLNLCKVGKNVTDESQNNIITSLWSIEICIVLGGVASLRQWICADGAFQACAFHTCGKQGTYHARRGACHAQKRSLYHAYKTGRKDTCPSQHPWRAAPFHCKIEQVCIFSSKFNCSVFIFWIFRIFWKWNWFLVVSLGWKHSGSGTELVPPHPGLVEMRPSWQHHQRQRQRRKKRRSQTRKERLSPQRGLLMRGQRGNTSKEHHSQNKWSLLHLRHRST